MTSLPIRNQLEDQLLTPRNSALLIIDYQPVGKLYRVDR